MNLLEFIQCFLLIVNPHFGTDITHDVYQAALKMRLKANQITAAIKVLLYRLIMVPVANLLANLLIVWSLAFLIGPYKMRSDVNEFFRSSGK
jgi:hypothetical protein